jgi:hypothetical protein
MLTEERTVPWQSDQHYSVFEVAEMLKLSHMTIRRMFEHEPDVLVLTNTPKGSRRIYRTLRIPGFVIERVHKRLSAA